LTRIYHWGYTERNQGFKNSRIKRIINMTIEEKKKLQVALKRIQGQVGGIEKMISEDKKCEAVVTQVVASMSSLKSVAKALLADAVDSCNKEEYAKLLKRFL